MEIALRQALLKEPILPTHNVCGLDVAKAHLTEDREDVLVDDGILGELGSNAQPRVDAAGVHGLDEGLDGDLDALVAGREEVALPSDGLLLGSESALRLFVALA